jgi:acyl transferase domain-containing protein
VTAARAEPIAVIGMSCRLPQADGPAEFWRLLHEGRDAITEASEQRWPSAIAGEHRRGGFLDQVDRFDAAFFGISPKEAAAMDPQQRLTLELAWEALEQARIVPDSLRGTDTGVFIGSIVNEYAVLAAGTPGPHGYPGGHRAIIANRVSHLLGFRGPSLTVDCGQSSSLVSVQLACESLRRGESTVALAGGVNLNLLAETTAAIGRFGALSSDGRCHVFDERANGYVRGEGAALVLLKPLVAALADGDVVHCVILGGAVNNDGGGQTLTSPSAQAQQEVIAAACAQAGVRPADVQYVELHGTGTPVGDPIEAAALGATLGAGRAPEQHLLVGSVKTNIGHLEGAAGIAGLLKVALSLAHRELPASLHFDRPNPAIPLAELGLRLVSASQAWPDPQRRLVAGVSAFGMGGTNCHLVLAEPPAADRPQPLSTPDLPWLLSARSAPALRAQASRLHGLLTSCPAGSPAGPGELAVSLIHSRTLFDHRAVVQAGAVPALRNLADGTIDPTIVTGAATRPDCVLVFPGQGSQWPAMARELMRYNPEFAERLTACAGALDEFVDYSLIDVLRGVPNAPDFDRVDVVQPALWAMMTALAQLWQGRGLRPAAVIGHSQGEIAAATAIGALSLSDGARVVALRSRAIAAVAGAGGMLSVAAPPEVAQAAVLTHAPRSGIAAVNGPRSVVVSGPNTELAELQLQLTVEGYRTKLLPVDYASHSAEMEQLRGEVLASLTHLTPMSVPTVFFSTLTGEPIDTASLNADYWYRSLRNPVRFADATRMALTAGHRLFVECSPHPVLVGAIAELAEELEQDVVVLGTLGRDEGGPARWDRAVAEAWVGGAQVRWGEPGPVPPAELVELPTYPFQRARHWSARPERAVAAGSVPAAADEPDRPGAGPVAPVLGSRRELRSLVLAVTAGVLGHADPVAIAAGQNFKDLGVDSAAAVELRKRLRDATGLVLPTGLLFDYPSPDQLADRLHALARSDIAPARSDTALAGPVSAAAEDDDPIVIVAMGCRYPGEVDSPEDLWRLVSRAGEAGSEFPTDRGWDLDTLFSAGADRSGTSDTRRGGFLAHADRFDAGFFGISPREAQAMDPQQRVLLEICWETLERAGLDPQSLRGSQTGVFIGAMAPDYGPRLHQPTGSADGHLLTGTALSVLSGRVAYTFGLEGPAVTVDTACSSSLVAIHQAVQALRRGECTLALAGGVTVMSSPGMFVEFSRQGGLSADGRCKAFSAEADGTGWAEGAGVLLLQRRSQAQRQGRPVLAVIRGSAVNQDGRSNGLTAPSGSAQQRVIRQALADARLEPGEVDLLEAHGTGTALGDPIEAEALLATYGADRPADRPLWLGSVKSNLGHTQAAARVAGIIKSVLALQHGTFPQTLHADEPTPLVDWSAGTVRLLTEPVRVTANRPLRAAVSGFGISGTNGHVILEAAEPARITGAEPAAQSASLVWVFTARSGQALAGYARRLLEFASAASQAELAATGAGLARRAVFSHRAAVVAADRAELLAALAAVAGGTPHPAALTGIATEVQPVFVFPGQGTQWAGMAFELLERSDVFWDWICRCDGALAAHIDWSVLDVLRGEDDAPALEGSDVIQPVLFAVMVALAALWRSMGVQPAAVLGHSQGEITAACVAGAISLEDAARIVALRSRALLRLTGTGGMLAVSLPPARVQELLEPWTDRLWPAILSGPESTVVAGDLDAIEEFSAAHGATVQLRRVAIDYAAHTPHIEALREQLTDILAGLSPLPTEVAVCSSLTGDFIDPTELTADYWYRGLRHPVRFSAAVTAAAGRAAADQARPLFIEVSPHPVLTGQISDILRATGQSGAALGSLRRDTGWQRMLSSFAQAWVAGAPLDWTRLLGRPSRQVELPSYPFEHRRYWLDSGGGPPAGAASSAHPMLGAVVPLADGGWLLTGRLSRAGMPWLADHAVGDSVLLPATALLELALQAAAVAGCDLVDDLILHRPLVLPEHGAVELQLTVGALDPDGRCALTVHARPAGEESWTLHATGGLAAAGHRAVSQAGWSPAGTELDLTDGYRTLAERGYRYGPAFQGLQRAWQDGDRTYAEVSLPEPVREHAEDFLLHPALLDAGLHALLLSAGSEELVLPFCWNAVTVTGPGAASLRVSFTELAQDQLEFAAQDATGQPIATGSVTLRRAPNLAPAGSTPSSQLPRVLDWVPAEAGELALTGQHWAVIGSGEQADRLVAELAEVGVSAACYYDLPSLAEMAATVPPVVLVPVATSLRTCLADAPSMLTQPGPPQPADDDLPYALRRTLAEVLDLIQVWLGDERFAGSRLTVLSPGSGALPATDLAAVAGSSVWGLVRSAATEHPGRFALLDHDDVKPAWPRAAAAVAGGDWQLAVRQGAVLVPRVSSRPVGPNPTPIESVPSLAAGTVLVTGGTSGLGALAAERLVRVHGARRLLLVSRRGSGAPGASELVQRLAELGAEVRIAACDVADRRALAAVLESIPAEFGLVGVVHAAGVLDDAAVDRLSELQLDTVLAAKADAAWHLHELTDRCDLALFALFSSVAGTLGTAGQANYAAANAFLDGLAGYRHSLGLPAVSIGWGLWRDATGLTAGLAEADLARLAYSGLAPLETDSGLALFDAALASARPAVLAAGWDRASLQARSDAGTLPSMLRTLVRAPRPAAVSLGADPVEPAGDLARRLSLLAQADARQLLVELVRNQVAGVLGYPNPNAVETGQGFNDLGFDSLTVVDLRNRLDQVTGLRLPASLAFDYPNVDALALHLLRTLAPAPPAPEESLRIALDSVQQSLAADGADRAKVVALLQRTLTRLESTAVSPELEDQLSTATDDEIFAFIDNQF